MPFEPAPKESPASRLAALIELGRVMNPDLKQGDRCGLMHGDEACAIGFAALAAGAKRDLLARSGESGIKESRRALGPLHTYFYFPIARVNDRGASLDEICASLREGELSKVTA